MDGGMSFEERRAAVEQACRALAGVEGELWAAGGADLGEFASLLDELAARVDAARVEVLREAVDRGEAGAGRSGAHAWLLDQSPSLRAGGSARVVRVAEAAHDDRYAALLAAVREARVPLVTAAVVVEEFERLSPRLADGADGPVLDGLVEVASWGRPKDVRGLRERLVAKYGAAGEFQAEQDRAARAALPVAGRSPTATGSVRVHDGRRRRGQGDDRGRGAGAVGAATGRRRAGPAAVGAAADGRPARGGAPRGRVGGGGGDHPQGGAVRDRVPRGPGGPVERRDGVRVG